MPTNKKQRWLEEAKAKISSVGWFKSKTYEILKSQKGLEIIEPVLVEKVALTLPSQIYTNSSHEVIIRIYPKIASEKDYKIQISNTDICTYDQETNTLIFSDVSGDVDITITMNEGGISTTKSITVLKPSNDVLIDESNVFIKDVEKEFNVSLLPFDTSETIEYVSSFNDNKEIKITHVEGSTYKLLADTLGTFVLKVKTSFTEYKINIYVVESIDDVVTDINLDIDEIYDLESSFFIKPTFEPKSATKKDYLLTLNDYSVANYFSGRNQIKTLKNEGDVEIKIKMLVGGFTKNFDFKVREGALPDPVIKSIEVTNLPEVVTVGDEGKLNINITPEQFTIDDLEIVYSGGLVGNGNKFNAVSSGEGYINISSKNSDVVYQSTIRIEEPIYLVDGINVVGVPTKILADGNVTNFTYSVTPQNATNKEIDINVNGNLILNSSKDGISSTTVGEGNIIFTSKDGSNVSVTKNVKVEPVLVDGIDISGISNNVLYDDLVKTFTINVTPSNATNKTYTLTSSSNVSITGNTFKTIGDGSAFITATSNDESKTTKTFTFNIARPNISSIEFTDLLNELEVGGKTSFNVNILPKYANNNITYTTNDVLSINQETKEVTALKVGNGIITATSNDEGGLVKTVNINVVPTLVTKLTINGLPDNVVRGQEYTYSVQVEPDNATDKTYTSSVTGNFEISGTNKVTATNSGSATLIVTSNDSAKVVGSVTRNVNNITVTNFAINGLPDDELEINSTYPVTIDFTPSNANFTDVNVDVSGNLTFTYEVNSGTIQTNDVGSGKIIVTNKSNSSVIYEKTYNIVDNTPPVEEQEPEA